MGGQVGIPQFGQFADGHAVVMEKRLFCAGGLIFGKSNVFQNIAPGPQGRVKGFAHNIIGPRLIERIDMAPVMGAGDDMQVGALLPGIGDQTRHGLGLVHRGNQNPRTIQPCSPQNIGAGRIAEIAPKPKPPHQFDRLHIVVQNHRGKARVLHQTVHDLSKTADPGDDDGAFMFDLIGFQLFDPVAQTARQIFIKQEEKRCDQHRQGDHQQQPLRHGDGQNLLLTRERNQDKAKFARLRQRQGEQHQFPPPQFKRPPDQEQNAALDQDQPKGQPKDHHRFFQQRGKVDARPHRDEKEPQ